MMFEAAPPQRSSSMKGMYLSGKPGIVQAMQMPPTFGQPPNPLCQPRTGTLQWTTGPLQPSLTRQRGSSPYSVAYSPCSAKPPRLQPSRTVRSNSHFGRRASSSSGTGARPARCRTR